MDFSDKIPVESAQQSYQASGSVNAYQQGSEMPPPPYSETTAPPPMDSKQSYDTKSPNTMSSVREPGFNVSTGKLEKPVAIPATRPKLGSPFLRAYPPSLEAFDISPEQFLKFVDDLNRVAVASPPLRVLGLAGAIVSFVPTHPVGIIGGAVNAAAGIGKVAASKIGTEVFLRKANKTIFGPRGLKAEVAKVEAVAKIAEIPVLNEKDKLDKHTKLLQSLDDLESELDLSGQERRLRALEPWIAPLDVTEIPDLSAPNNVLSKMHSGASERQREKEEKKLHKEREKAQKRSDKDAKIDRKLERRMEKLEMKESEAHEEGAGNERRLSRELEKIERRREKAEDKHARRLDKNEDRKDKLKDKEEKTMRKILWLMIRNLDADSGPGKNPDLESSEGEMY